jgi:hypothetical protein
MVKKTSIKTPETFRLPFVLHFLDVYYRNIRCDAIHWQASGHFHTSSINHGSLCCRIRYTEMTLSAENKAYLDELRDRIKNKHVEYNEDDLLKLSSVYGQVLEFSGIKGGGKIDKSCSSCIMEPVKILFNYITYHEPVVPVHRATIVKEVRPEEVFGGRPTVVEYGNDNTFPEKLNLSGEMKEVKALRIVDGIPSEVTMDIPADLPAGYSVEGTVKETKPVHTEPPVKKTRRPRTTKPKK